MDVWNQEQTLENRAGSILVIEPDPALALAMESELSRNGFRVSVARGHLAALGLMEDHQEPRVVLVPMEPTDIAGLDFVHLLRHRNQFQSRNSRIIMTGAGENLTRISLEDQIIDDFLLRPYFPGELTWRVRKAWRTLQDQQPAAPFRNASSDILSIAELKRALHDELNKSIRKHGHFSLVAVALSDLEELRLNYGLMIAEWMEQDLSGKIRAGMRSYDRIGALAWGRYCMLAPDLDSAQLRVLLHRMGQLVERWNESVAQNSHIRIPLTPKVKPLTISPQFDPKHVTGAVAMLWDWVEGADGHADIQQADYSRLVLTSEEIMSNPLTDPSSAGAPPSGGAEQSEADRSTLGDTP